jgi:asparagine synthetase B (glutamine-hydrolysing)
MDESWYQDVWPHPANTSGLTRLEVITGWTAGIDLRAPDIAAAEPRDDPVAALERALLPAVATSPCYVAFSGGRDSSVLLALATRLARREGLEDPIPLTMRFHGVPEGEESAWQLDVVKHLRLEDWKVVQQDADIDLVGEQWQQSVRETGLRWPASAHGLLPLQRAARGGAFVHGDGGDQVFAGWSRAAIIDAIARRRRLALRDMRGLIRAYAPAPARRAIETRLAPTPAPWLVPAALRAWAAHQGRAHAAEPRTWPAFLRWTRRERATFLMLETLERQSRGAGTTLFTPFWDAGFLQSLGHWGGRLGQGRRTALMRALFTGVLPDHVLERTTKAHFTRAFFNEPTRQFARSWDGPVPEPDVVMREPLRAAWLSDLPPNTSALLLQASWLLAHDQPRLTPSVTRPTMHPGVR